MTVHKKAAPHSTCAMAYAQLYCVARPGPRPSMEAINRVLERIGKTPIGQHTYDNFGEQYAAGVGEYVPINRWDQR